MDGDHAKLFLCPLLNVAITELDGHFPWAFDYYRTCGFFAVHVHGKAGGKSLESVGPARGCLKGATKKVPSPRVIRNGRWVRPMFHMQAPLRIDSEIVSTSYTG
jgi:hypothetical protein